MLKIHMYHDVSYVAFNEQKVVQIISTIYTANIATLLTRHMRRHVKKFTLLETVV